MSDKDSKTIGRTMEETREFHRRYLRAINSPVRRDILRALRDGDGTIESLQAETGLDAKTLEWHLSILIHGFCVEKEEKSGKTFYRPTEEAEVVDYTDKEKV